jgi:hypothetical protein
VRIGRAVRNGVVVVLAVVSCQGTKPFAEPPLSAQAIRAVAAAEAFMRQHGYTDQPGDPAAIEREEEYRSLRESGVPITPERVLRSRRNSVVAKAYGLCRDRGAGRPGWTIYFEHHAGLVKKMHASLLELAEPGGTALGVSPDLTEMALFHMDVRLDTADVVLRPPTKRPSPVESWTIPALDDLRELVVRRLVDSTCAHRFDPAWPLCINVGEAETLPAYASPELLLRLRRGTQRQVLSVAECIDKPLGARTLRVRIHCVHRYADDAELLVHAQMFVDPAEPPEAFDLLTLDGRVVMRRSGWVLSQARLWWARHPRDVCT